MQEKLLRQEILDLGRKYADTAWQKKPFQPGIDAVPVSGKVFDSDDLATLLDASLDGWLTAGRYAQEFEKSFAAIMGTPHALLVNSGSSANLLAIATLASQNLSKKRLEPGSEVITVASGFPTTVNPLLQHGLIPVFVDISLPTYNVDIVQLQEAITPKTRAIILAHTLGNPFNLQAVMAIAKAHDLWVIEDACDAVGATYQNRPVGSFGDIATTSFYPAHHITMGEGGALLTSRGSLRKIAASLRDWGRDCWCEPGHDDTCGKRFQWHLGSLPYGYDHKYIYSDIGYNLKVTDMQAACGVSQLKKLPSFIQARRNNFAYLKQGLLGLEEFLILPEATPESHPSWFGFPITLKDKSPLQRRDLIAFLESRRIATRQLFGGNLTRQPAYRNAPFRIASPLTVADKVMNDSFWVGVYPGLTTPQLDFMIESFHEAFSHAKVLPR